MPNAQRAAQHAILPTAGVVEELYDRAAFDQLFPRGCVAAIAYVPTSSAVFADAHWEADCRTWPKASFAASVLRMTKNVWPLIAGPVVTDGIGSRRAHKRRHPRGGDA